MNYGVTIGAIQQGQLSTVLATYCAVINDLVRQSTEAAKGEDVIKISTEALNCAYADGTLKISDDVKSYQKGMDGFFHRDRLFIPETAFLSAVRRYCVATHRVICDTMDSIGPELVNAGILIS